jgi:hypothetical protein
VQSRSRSERKMDETKQAESIECAEVNARRWLVMVSNLKLWMNALGHGVNGEVVVNETGLVLGEEERWRSAKPGGGLVRVVTEVTARVADFAWIYIIYNQPTRAFSA